MSLNIIFCLFSTKVDVMLFFFFSSRRRHTSWPRDWSSDVCSSDLPGRLRPWERSGPPVSSPGERGQQRGAGEAAPEGQRERRQRRDPDQDRREGDGGDPDRHPGGHGRLRDSGWAGSLHRPGNRSSTAATKRSAAARSAAASGSGARPRWAASAASTRAGSTLARAHSPPSTLEQSSPSSSRRHARQAFSTRSANEPCRTAQRRATPERRQTARYSSRSGSVAPGPPRWLLGSGGAVETCSSNGGRGGGAVATEAVTRLSS